MLKLRDVTVKSAGTEVVSLLINGYLAGLIVFGLWSMMHHLHWLVPFVLVSAGIVTQRAWLIYFNIALATVMAFVGVASLCHLAWYYTIFAVPAPLLLLLGIWSLMNRGARRDQ